MTLNICKILDVFDTTIGTVVLIGFYSDSTPYIGMYIKDKSGSKRKITGVGTNRIYTIPDRFRDENFKSIWDCKLESVNHEAALEIGSEAELIEDNHN